MNMKLIECRCALRQALQLGYSCGRLEKATVDCVLDRFGIGLACTAMRNYEQLLRAQCGDGAVDLCTAYLNTML